MTDAQRLAEIEKSMQQEICGCSYCSDGTHADLAWLLERVKAQDALLDGRLEHEARVEAKKKGGAK